MFNLIYTFYFLIIKYTCSLRISFWPNFIQTMFLQLNVISKFLANVSHKVIVAYRPLIEGLSKVTSSA